MISDRLSDEGPVKDPERAHRFRPVGQVEGSGVEGLSVETNGTNKTNWTNRTNETHIEDVQ